MKIRNMTRCGIFAAILAVCGWIALPLGEISVSLQTFGVALCLGTLGGGLGTAAIFVYLFLGAIGIPVFTGFQAGPAALLGPTGGYLWGFLLAGLLFIVTEKNVPLWINLILCQLIIYITGTAWYYFAYAQVALWPILAKCVLPYLLPDALKLWLAVYMVKRNRIATLQ